MILYIQTVLAMLSTTLPPYTPVPVLACPLWVNAAQVTVAAGFPSPAEDHLVERIDLMKQLIRHPQATFFVRVAGDSMQGAGILNGSVVLVDKAIRPTHGHIVIGTFCATGQVLAWSMRKLTLGRERSG